jgi:hypothetical protein
MELDIGAELEVAHGRQADGPRLGREAEARRSAARGARRGREHATKLVYG